MARPSLSPACDRRRWSPPPDPYDRRRVPMFAGWTAPLPTRPLRSLIARLRGTGLRKQLINIGHLTTGNFANAGIMLISTAIAARALGPHDYGILILALSFGRTIERVCRFESWQPLIRFAAEMEGKADPGAFRRLFAYGLMFDALAAFAAAMITIALATFGGPLFGFSARHVDLAVIYSAALLINYTGMPTAALRLAGKFATIAYTQYVGNVIQVFLALWCWHSGAGLYGFMITWTVAQMIGAVLFFSLAVRALSKQGIGNPLTVPIGSLKGGFPGFLSFAWTSNISMTLRTMTSEADALVVGALAGPKAAGFYYIAKRIAKAGQQIGAQVQAVIYPDIARMWAKGNIARFRSTTLHVQAMLGAVGIALLVVVWLFGAALLRIGFGTVYGDAYPLLVTQLVAVILAMHAGPSRTALLAMNKPTAVLIIAAVGMVTFFAVAFWLVPRIGPIGANIGQIALALVIAVAMDAIWLGTARHASIEHRRASSQS